MIKPTGDSLPSSRSYSQLLTQDVSVTYPMPLLNALLLRWNANLLPHSWAFSQAWRDHEGNHLHFLFTTSI